MATKASALCGAPPSTPCCVCCFGAPPSCTEVFTLWVIQIPPQDAARAACAPLLGPCCFLPPVPAAFPGALLSFSCWPPPAAFPLVLFRSLASFARLAAVVFFGLLFGAPLLWPFVVVVGVVFVWFLFGLVFLVFCLFVGGLVGCAGCQLTEVTKDY